MRQCEKIAMVCSNYRLGMKRYTIYSLSLRAALRRSNLRENRAVQTVREIASSGYALLAMTILIN